jgi:hypothetical protein
MRGPKVQVHDLLGREGGVTSPEDEIQDQPMFGNLVGELGLPS